MPRENLSARQSKCTTDDLQTVMAHHLNALWEGSNSAFGIPPLMIWGPPGVGKSAVVREYCKSHGIGFIDVRLAQREPVDMRGLPVPDGNTVRWLVSSEWPRDPDSRGVILFDELTAADRTLQVAAYEFILDRRLGDIYQVPDGWYIMAAGNRALDRAVTAPMSSALANRFCHLEIDADLKSWCGWAVNNNIHPDVIAFLRSQPGALLDMSGDLERGWPSPRSWERVSTELGLAEKGGIGAPMLQMLIAGLVGPSHAYEFSKFRDMASRLPDAEAMMRGDVLVNRIPKKADERFVFCSSLAHYLRNCSDWPDLIGGFLSIGLHLPSDFASLAMVDAMHARDADEISLIVNHPMFSSWSKKHGSLFAERSGKEANDIANAALSIVDDVLDVAV